MNPEEATNVGVEVLHKVNENRRYTVPINRVEAVSLRDDEVVTLYPHVEMPGFEESAAFNVPLSTDDRLVREAVAERARFALDDLGRACWNQLVTKRVADEQTA